MASEHTQRAPLEPYLLSHKFSRGIGSLGSSLDMAAPRKSRTPASGHLTASTSVSGLWVWRLRDFRGEGRKGGGS